MRNKNSTKHFIFTSHQIDYWLKATPVQIDISNWFCRYTLTLDFYHIPTTKWKSFFLEYLLPMVISIGQSHANDFIRFINNIVWGIQWLFIDRGKFITLHDNEIMSTIFFVQSKVQGHIEKKNVRCCLFAAYYASDK